MPQNAITRYTTCLLAAAMVPARAWAGDIAEGWWAPGDPAPISFGFAEGSRILPDGRTAYRIHFYAEGASPTLIRLADHRSGPPAAGYRLPDVGAQVLVSIADNTPRAGHVVLGHSVQGRPIDAVWLGQPPGSGAPVYRILGGHHGDEWSSFEVPLAIAEFLAASDGVDADVTAILDTSTVWIAPYINPDGIMGGSRYNAATVDLNRNYDFAWSPVEFASGAFPFSEPETRAVRSNCHYDLPFAGLTYHSGATNIGYVWNYTQIPAPDLTLLVDWSEAYADTTGDPDFWVTNGAAWYLTTGDSNDWSYGRYGVPDFTVELTEDKAPPPEDIDIFVPRHVDAALAFLGNRPNLSGVVVDDETDSPVMAMITLDPPTAPFYADPVAGAFHRRVPPGDIALTVSAIGYETVTTTVSVPALDVAIRLVRGDIQAKTLASSAILEPTPLQLPSAWTGPVALRRPGSDPVILLSQRGRFEVEPARLARGAWTVEVDTLIWLNGLILADEALRAVTRDGDILALDGDFDAGSRAWAIFGPHRSLHALPILEESPTTLIVDGIGVPESGRADVMVLSGGRHLAWIDIYDIEDDTSIFDDGPILGIPVGCACEVSTGHLGLHWLSVLLPILIRRRSS